MGGLGPLTTGKVIRLDGPADENAAREVNMNAIHPSPAEFTPDELADAVVAAHRRG